MNIVKYINKIMYRVNSNIIRTMNSYNIIYNIKNFLPIYTLIIGIVGIVIIHFYFLKKEVIIKQEIKENNRSGENERLKIKEKELKMIYIKKRKVIKINKLKMNNLRNGNNNSSSNINNNNIVIS